MAILAFSRAIAEKAMAACEIDMAAERKIYKDMATQAMKTLMTWPDQVKQRDIRAIRKRLDLFCQKTGWDESPRHIQTYINFSLELLERLKDDLGEHGCTQKKLHAIDALIDTEMAVYNRFTSGIDREYPLCLCAGLKAADVWNSIMEAA
jgi:hypothetical protein